MIMIWVRARSALAVLCAAKWARLRVFAGCTLCAITAAALEPSWQERSAEFDLPAGIGFHVDGEQAWYLDIAASALANMALQLVPALKPAATPMREWAAGEGVIAAINGGFFAGDRALSLVAVDGQVLAHNIPALTRNGVQLPVLRSAFFLHADNTSSIHWSYQSGSSAQEIQVFEKPLPYAAGQVAPIAVPKAGRPLALHAAIGGGPRLLTQGVETLTYNEEVFWGSGVELDDVRPRTAICSRQNGDIILYVHRGIALRKVPARLRQLGCWDAMNLDGGGSSAFYLGGQEVFDQGRPVPAALLLQTSG